MKLKLIVIILCLSLLLVGCQKWKGMLYEQDATAPSTVESAPVAAPVQEISSVKSCEASSECDGKLCIDNTCKTLAEFYTTDCSLKCSFSAIAFSTSDGENYTLAEGQGTYTAAGALEWKVMSIPDFCLTEKVVVPLLLIKKNYGKVVAEEIVTLQEGQSSKVLTHPAIKSVKFTVKADKVETSCT